MKDFLDNIFSIQLSAILFYVVNNSNDTQTSSKLSEPRDYCFSDNFVQIY